MASSLVIFQSFRSLFTDSSHVKFGLPRPLLTLLAHFNCPLCTGASEDLRCDMTTSITGTLNPVVVQVICDVSIIEIACMHTRKKEEKRIFNMHALRERGACACMQGRTHILARLISFHLDQRLGVARVSMREESWSLLITNESWSTRSTTFIRYGHPRRKHGCLERSEGCSL